jgi:hypothetical protein
VAGGHGGARAGAGRPRGQASRKTRAIADGALKEGISPLEFILQVMRDPSAPLTLRCEMAVAAMPYAHPRLTHVLPPEPEPRTSTIINVIAYPAGSSIDRNGVVRLPAPTSPADDVIEAEAVLEPVRKPNTEATVQIAPDGLGVRPKLNPRNRERLAAALRQPANRRRHHGWPAALCVRI